MLEIDQMAYPITTANNTTTAAAATNISILQRHVIKRMSNNKFIWPHNVKQ